MYDYKKYLTLIAVFFLMILMSCLTDPEDKDDKKDDEPPAVIDTFSLKSPDSVWNKSLSLDTVSIIWNKVDSAEGYIVVLMNGSGNPLDTFSTLDTVIDLGITPEHTYMVSVGTYKGDKWSKHMKNTPLIRVYSIRNPRNVKLISKTVYSATISFDATEDNNLEMDFSYRIYLRDHDGVKLDSIDIDSSARTAVVSGLQANKSYKISIVSVSSITVNTIDSNCVYDTSLNNYNFRKLPYVYVSTYADLAIPADNNLASVKGGIFLMGYLWGRDSMQIWEAGPLHEVIVSSFYMGRYEITASQYVNFLNSIKPVINFDQTALLVGTDTLCDTGKTYWPLSYDGTSFSIKAGKENYPMVGIHWNGASAYCNWLSKQYNLDTCYDAQGNCDFSKNGYRLPTEAEFEYTASNAQSGHKQRFPWGFEWKTSEACVAKNGPDPVGTYPALNGIYDLAGNIIEYMNDWSDASSEATSHSPYYQECLSNGVVVDPRGPVSQVQSYGHLMRGGSYETGISGNVVTYRYVNPCNNLSDYGFRVARNAQ